MQLKSTLKEPYMQIKWETVTSKEKAVISLKNNFSFSPISLIARLISFLFLFVILFVFLLSLISLII